MKKTAASVALIGFLGSGIWAIEARYAKAADVRELRQDIRGQADEVKLVILEGRLFDLTRTERTRKLTDLEWERKAELEREVDRLKLSIRNPRP